MRFGPKVSLVLLFLFKCNHSSSLFRRNIGFKEELILGENLEEQEIFSNYLFSRFQCNIISFASTFVVLSWSNDLLFIVIKEFNPGKIKIKIIREIETNEQANQQFLG